MGTMRRACVAAGFSAWVIFASRAEAARVYVDCAVGSSGDGSSWAVAKKTIGEGLAAAAGDEVWVAEGTYYESIELPDGVALYGGFAKTEGAPSDRDLKAHRSIIDGRKPVAGSPPYHVVDMTELTDARLDGFTVTGGKADLTGVPYFWNDPRSHGGGVLCWAVDSAVAIANCTITSNTATARGGGLYCYGSSPSFTGCVINGNSALTGGGIYCYYSTPSFLNCTISGNSASSGAGMYCSEASPTIASCVIGGNTAGYSGGGIHCHQSSPLIESSTISGNSASDGGGMGLDAAFTVFGESSPMESSMIGGKEAQGSAGLGASGSSPRLRNCTISGNSADVGGGMSCHGGTSVVDARMSLTNCTISQNSASGHGGGVLCDWGAGLECSNTIFEGNTHYAICEDLPDSEAVPLFCLFHNNPDGDFMDDGWTIYSGANAINRHVAGASNNREGDPKFVAGAGGVWSAPPAYDAAGRRTTLTDSAASFAPGSLAGKLINPQTGQLRQAVIADNTATSITVFGDAAGWVNQGDAYALIDYHLQNGSCALDRGDPSQAPSTDFEGDARPGADGHVDIGVDEAPYLFWAGEDEVAPESSVEGAPPVVFTYAFELPWAGWDAGSGLRDVALYYRKDGGPWTAYGRPLTTSPFYFYVSETGGPGEYEFYTLATDNAGNTEAPPLSPDDQTVVMPDFAGARVYVDRDATGRQTGSSWAGALHEIGAGLAVAQAFGVGEVWVAEGAYWESIGLLSGVALYGGFDGTESRLEERDFANHPAIIDAGGAEAGGPANRPVTIRDVANCRIDGFTITGGRVGPPGPDWDGGGIYCEGARHTVAIANCVIRDNSAYLSGGGVCCNGSSPSITDCAIRGNSTSGYYWSTWYCGGGGVYCHDSSPSIVNCAIIGNLARGYDYGAGGGVLCLGEPSPSITHCLIGGNSASGGLALGLGGGVFCYGSSPAITNCTISGNSALVGGGGGVEIIDGASSPSITNCLISGNVSTGEYSWGGGMGYSGSSASIANCVIRGNSAVYRGGGLDCYGECQPRLVNVIFENNAKHAVYESSADADPSVTSCLFRDNPDGDYFDENSTSLTGADAINSQVDNAFGNVDGDPRFVGGARGTWTAGAAYDPAQNTTTLTDSHASFAPGSLAGQVINADTNQRFEAPIVANSATTVEVIGDLTGFAGEGDSYQVVDCHLDDGSAAIDAGTAAGAPLDDMDGQRRPYDTPGVGKDGTGTEFDIGADERYPDPQLRSVQETGPATIRLQWADSRTSQTMFLGLAWDIYTQEWVLDDPDSPWGPWHYFPPAARSGEMSLGHSGAYHVWISALLAGGPWALCADPWTGVVYGGEPHAPLDAWAEDLGGLRIRLHWRPEVYGIWLYAIAAYRDGEGWVATGLGGQTSQWHFIDYGQMGYDAGAADFFAGWADLMAPSGGDYWLYVLPVGWLSPLAMGQPALAWVQVAP